MVQYTIYQGYDKNETFIGKAGKTLYIDDNFEVF